MIAKRMSSVGECFIVTHGGHTMASFCKAGFGLSSNQRMENSSCLVLLVLV